MSLETSIEHPNWSDFSQTTNWAIGWSRKWSGKGSIADFFEYGFGADIPRTIGHKTSRVFEVRENEIDAIRHASELNDTKYPDLSPVVSVAVGISRLRATRGVVLSKLGIGLEPAEIKIGLFNDFTGKAGSFVYSAGLDQQQFEVLPKDPRDTLTSLMHRIGEMAADNYFDLSPR